MYASNSHHCKKMEHSKHLEGLAIPSISRQQQAQIFARQHYEAQVARHRAAMAAYYHQAHYFREETSSHPFAFVEYGMKHHDACLEYSPETHFSGEFPSRNEAFTTPVAADLYLDSHDGSHYATSSGKIPSIEQISESECIRKLIGEPLSLAVTASNIGAPPGLSAPRDLSVLNNSEPAGERAPHNAESRVQARSKNSFAALKPRAKTNVSGLEKRQAPSRTPKSNSNNKPNNAPRKLHTWMLRNIPCKLYQDELMQILNSCGLEGKFDFFFSPVDAKKNALRKRNDAHEGQSNANNKGYAFINLKNAGDSDLLFRICNGKDFWTPFSNTNSKKRCIVCPAQNQGLLENIKYFKNSVLNHSLVAEYRNDCAQGHATPSTVASSMWNGSPQMLSKDSDEPELGLSEEGTFLQKSTLCAMEAEASHREQELVEKRRRLVEAMQMPFFEYDEAAYAGVEHYVDSMMEQWNL